MDPTDVPILPRGVRLHHDKVRDQWVLLAPERAVTLDQISHAILSVVDGVRSFGEITAHLAAKFDAPLDRIETDCANMLNALRARRFLDVTQ